MLNNQIINWYCENKRDLPWRKTKDPYLIWISEIMLQQTRVATAIDYYYKFTERFPTVSDLAQADEQEVLNLWQGLGYYSRARNLHHAAKTIDTLYKGVFPNTYKEILNLKGIGAYTAAAISSFAFNLPYAAIDGNVYRVLSRLFGIDTPIDSTEGKKIFQELAQETMGNATPEIYNQAIIEFGALQCTPKSPNCSICPVNSSCFASNSNIVDQFPKKSKQIKPKNRYFYYLFLSCSGRFAIEKREGKDIWKNMYQYPLIESNTKLSTDLLIQSDQWKEIFNSNDLVIQSISDNIVHKLTHQNINTRFIHIEISADELKNYERFIFINKKEAEQYPLPKLIDNHIKYQDF
ncbi:A/G-specific adenine glycosylase [Marinifilum caeruleilacunae]|uniref:Adenine DNA glycosylase n=1 Tax=Marinifilum caeruleilacunae TaxID=2499076 RepID=A0ABX1WZE5_9BACT|nr:A/G-specific adenine glycosylase [Marinifilum caeruleilacunae]NOU61477.1 A/G-specific adenine glycosylase [Marinifilum caeruleilacunae]